MKKIITTLTLLLAISLQSFACECGEYKLRELDSLSYESSDLVIIGNVIKTGINYQIEIIEVLKGTVQKEIIYGLVVSKDGYVNSCTSYPDKKGKYLFYLNRVEENGIFYEYSQCSGTRKLDFSTVVVSLDTNKTKKELIAETEKWIDELRKRKNNNNNAW